MNARGSDSFGVEIVEAVCDACLERSEIQAGRDNTFLVRLHGRGVKQRVLIVSFVLRSENVVQIDIKPVQLKMERFASARASPEASLPRSRQRNEQNHHHWAHSAPSRGK